MTMTATNLDACPCCGSEAKFTKVVDEEAEDAGGWFVICLNEDCAMTTGTRLGDDPRPLLAQIWNRRVVDVVWQPIETAPTTESESFLILRRGIVVQVSWFEGRLYPDAREACVDWHDGITDATHWAPPLPPPPSQESGRG
jgi:hypothetical protein